MDRGTAESAEVFDAGANLDIDARRAASIDVDSSTLDIVEATLDSGRDAVAAHYRCPLVRREGAGFLRYGPGAACGLSVA